MSGPKTPEEAQKFIREAAANGRMGFAPDTITRTVNEYVQRIFREIRIVSRGEPPKRGIWASDEVTIGFVLDGFGKSDRDREVLATVSTKLGIPLAAEDTFADVALRLRDHENALRSADRQ